MPPTSYEIMSILLSKTLVKFRMNFFEEGTMSGYSFYVYLFMFLDLLSRIASQLMLTNYDYSAGQIVNCH
jgi:hypothetical protein